MKTWLQSMSPELTWNLKISPKEPLTLTVTDSHLPKPPMAACFLENSNRQQGGKKQIHREANWWKQAIRRQRFSVGARVAIIWMSYKIQPDPINMPPDRRASHQPNLGNQWGTNESEQEALYGHKQTKTTQYRLEETDASNDINLLTHPHLT